MQYWAVLHSVHDAVIHKQTGRELRYNCPFAGDDEKAPTPTSTPTPMPTTAPGSDSFIQDDPLIDLVPEDGFPSGQHDQPGGASASDRETQRRVHNYIDNYYNFDPDARVTADGVDATAKAADGSTTHRLVVTGRFVPVHIWCTASLRNPILPDGFSIKSDSGTTSQKHALPRSTLQRMRMCACDGKVVGDDNSLVLFNLCGTV